jgi:hypothetical protein
MTKGLVTPIWGPPIGDPLSLRDKELARMSHDVADDPHGKVEPDVMEVWSIWLMVCPGQSGKENALYRFLEMKYPKRRPRPNRRTGAQGSYGVWGVQYGINLGFAIPYHSLLLG